MAVTTNAAQFAANLNRYGQGLRRRGSDVVNGVTLLVYGEILEPWPVDTGRSRFSWAISLHVAGSFLPPPGSYRKPDPAQFVSVLQGASLEATRVIFTNLDYPKWIEFGNSRRAGLHILSMVVARWRARLRSGG
jgi:hypothetical protein